MKTLRRAAHAEEAGSRCLWACWLLLFGVAEFTALRTRRIAPLTNVVRWTVGAKPGSSCAWRKAGFVAFGVWFYRHIYKES